MAVSSTGGTSRVVVVGSVNEDIVVRASRLPAAGETLAGSSVSRGGGGKGANQAVAAARAGGRTLLVACVGDDAVGRGQLGALEVDGVDVAGVRVLLGVPTGTAVVSVDDAGENQIVIVAGANDHLDAAHVTTALEAAGLTADDVVLAGFEVPDAPVVAAARAARAVGATLLVNPAPARELHPDLLAAAPILLPNQGELAELTGESDPTLGARTLARTTGAPVVVTLGPDGVLVVDASTTQKVAGRRVEVVDTTGAGDTFAGVLAARIAQGEDLGRAARAAVVAASLSVTAAGARGGMPASAAIEQALTVSPPRR